MWFEYVLTDQGFNPRLPGGRRPDWRLRNLTCSLFQSTPSGGKATSSTDSASSSQSFQSTPSGGKATEPAKRRRTPPRSFNPRLPGGRRRLFLRSRINPQQFQSTPSGGKATLHPKTITPVTDPFQSTPSGGKATRAGGSVDCDCVVSIHAFRGEGDSNPPARRRGIRRFNPRLPGGRRRHRCMGCR